MRILVSLGLGSWFSWSWCLLFSGYAISEYSLEIDTMRVSASLSFFASSLILFSCSFLSTFLEKMRSKKYLSASTITELLLITLGTLAFVSNNYTVLGAVLMGIGYAILTLQWISCLSTLPRHLMISMVSPAILVGVLLLALFSALQSAARIAFTCTLPIVSSICFFIILNRNLASLINGRSQKNASHTPLVSEFRSNHSIAVFNLILFTFAYAMGYMFSANAEIVWAISLIPILPFLGAFLASLVLIVITDILHVSIPTTLVFQCSIVLMGVGILLTLSSSSTFTLLATIFVIACWTLLEILYWPLVFIVHSTREKWSLFRTMLFTRSNIFFGIAFGMLTCFLLSHFFPSKTWVNPMFIALAIGLFIMAAFLPAKIHANEQVIPLKHPTLTIKEEKPDKNQSGSMISSPTPTTHTIDEICTKLANAHDLTSREGEVLLLLARGRNTPSIAESLVLSRSTVKTHVRHVYEKLGIHKHQELIDLIESQTHE